ncbi:glycosyltransferase [Oryzobacter telluris]|uniref:glycosyltransferase n=1 Tax=Oryzobacter telluris TaxID=3149179 RepID=UPI00370D3A2C
MRIRYVLLNAYGGGGTIRTTLSMAGLLASRGHDVEVASVTQRRPRPRFPVPPGVRLVSLASPVHPVRGLTRAALWRTRSRLAHPNDRLGAGLTRAHDLWLRRYLAAQDDCVVVGTRMTVNLALAGLRTERQVAVAQEHNHMPKAPAVRASYVEAYPRLDAVVALTEGDAASYRSLLGDTCPVDVVPNALPHGVGLRRSPLTSTVAVSAGSLIRRKGFDLLVDAWRPVAAAHPDWRLRIYGVGAEADALTAQIAAARLADSVTLEGFEPDIARRFDEASLFVLPSRREGMPMVLLEAMAAGLPVVAFDCPTGPAEVLDGGTSGVLVPNGETEALSESLIEVLGDASQRRRWADAAALRVRAFDPEATADRWEALFSGLADRRGLAVGR